jgi:hypothetical protein
MPLRAAGQVVDLAQLALFFCSVSFVNLVEMGEE